MKKTALLLSVFGASLLVSCCCLQDRAPGQVELFNGKDLTGWKHFLAEPNVPASQVWTVEDGILICRGEPMGYLETEQTYRNFRLEVEYRWAPGQEPGNSGLFSRINGPAKPLPRCIETQLKHGDAGDLFGFHGMSLSGDPARSRKIPNHQLGGDISAVSKISGNEKKPGEWNQAELVVDGPNITVRLNGQIVNQAGGIEVVAGPVALQSEGGEIHFRNVRITPLP